jgi:hypothetical protein
LARSVDSDVFPTPMGPSTAICFQGSWTIRGKDK